MAGAAVRGRRDRVRPTRPGGCEDALLALARARRAEANAGRDHRRRGQVGLRARGRRGGTLCAGWRPSSPTRSRSSAGTCAARVRGPRRRVRGLVCGPMLAACRPYARWTDVFCERGAFDADQSRAMLAAGREAGLGLRVHGNQLGPGPGVSSPSSSTPPPSITAPTSPTTTSGRWRAATPSPRSCRPPTSRPASPTPTPAGRSTPASRRARDQHQPGLELHDLDVVLHRARRPRHADDGRRGAGGGDARRRPRSAP